MQNSNHLRCRIAGQPLTALLNQRNSVSASVISFSDKNRCTFAYDGNILLFMDHDNICCKDRNISQQGRLKIIESICLGCLLGKMLEREFGDIFPSACTSICDTNSLPGSLNDRKTLILVIAFTEVMSIGARIICHRGCTIRCVENRNFWFSIKSYSGNGTFQFLDTLVEKSSWCVRLVQ